MSFTLRLVRCSRGNAEFLLKGFDLLAYGWLCRMQLLGRAGEALPLGDGHEVFEIAQFQACQSNRFNLLLREKRAISPITKNRLVSSRRPKKKAVRQTKPRTKTTVQIKYYEY